MGEIEVELINFIIMFFGIIFLIRILFIACMVFIIGYVFGNFSKRQGLRRFTRVAAILAIVLFFLSNVLTMRAAWGGKGNWDHHGRCYFDDNDKPAIEEYQEPKFDQR